MSRHIMFIVPAYGTDYELSHLPGWHSCRTPPLGLLSIISYLDSKGHITRLVDIRELVFRHRTIDVLPLIAHEVDAFRPDAIGMELLTAHFEEVRKLAVFLKEKYPGIHIVAGGVHPSVEPELTLTQIDGLDSVCVGAGEEVCLDMAEGNTLTEIPGLMLRGSEKAFRIRNVETDLDKYPFPYQGIHNVDFYTGYSAYALPNWLCKSLIMVTARGCPFSCRFCASDWSRPYRQHSIEYVMEMVKFLARLGIDTLHIRDETLGVNRTRLKALCEAFRRSGLFLPSGTLRWRALMRADQAEPDLLAMMKASGCFAVGIGMESGTDRMLKLISKKTTVDQNAQATRYVVEAGLQLSAFFIVGFPTETEEEILQTIDFMNGLRTNNKALLSFRPMPGSPFYYDFLESGLLDRHRVNWQTLGDISLLPEQSFSAMKLDRLQELTQLARQRSYGEQFVQVFEDIAGKCPDLVRDVARSVGVQITPLPGTGGEPKFVDTLRTDFRLFRTRIAGKLGAIKRHVRPWIEKIRSTQPS